jgi:predicted O-methyltransferase YrrM
MSVLTHYLLWSAGLAGPTTQTTADERNCLARHATGRTRVAEIGVWHGVTTCVLRRAMDATGLLYAIDPYHVGRLGVSFQRLIARREVGRVPGGRVEWLRMTGADAARYLAANDPAPVDFVFIDGDHSFEGLQADWEGWSPLVAVGGLVALHDSRSSPSRNIDDAGSVRYTSTIIRHDTRFEMVEEVDSLTVLARGRG